MALPPIPRFLSSPFRLKKSNFSLITTALFTTSSSAENYWTYLQKHGSSVEKALNTVKAKLDTSCINEVLRKFALNQPLLGLKFSIWAGLQPNCRHSSYMYRKACQLFDINRNPQAIAGVIEAYRVEGCLVSVKMFKIALNLCREANLADEGLCVLRKMKEFNCQPDTTAYNVVIKLFCDKGNMDAAVELTRVMGLINPYPDMITYIVMIKGFCNVGRLQDASGLFKVMRGDGCLSNAVAYSALLDGFCKFGSLERAVELLGEMEKEGGDCSPNVVTYTSVIQSFCERSRTVEASSILD